MIPLEDARYEVARSIERAESLSDDTILAWLRSADDDLDRIERLVADSIDAAWTSCEAVLPDGWQMAIYRRSDGTYTAVAKRFGGGRRERAWGTTINGPTGAGSLVKALRYLATRLSQEGRSDGLEGR